MPQKIYLYENFLRCDKFRKKIAACRFRKWCHFIKRHTTRKQTGKKMPTFILTPLKLFIKILFWSGEKKTCYWFIPIYVNICQKVLSLTPLDLAGPSL
jgi:hypothetical protein